MNVPVSAKIRTLIERFDPNSGIYNFTTRIINDYTREQLIDVVQKLPIPPDSMHLFQARVVTTDVIYWRDSKDKEAITCLTNKIGRQPLYKIPFGSLSDHLLPLDKKALNKLRPEKRLDNTNPSYFDEPISLWDMFLSGLSILFILFVLWFAIVGDLTNPALITVLFTLIVCDGIVFCNGIWNVIQVNRGAILQEIRLEVPYLDDFKTRNLTSRILLVFLIGIMVIATFLGAFVSQSVPHPPPDFLIFTPDIFLQYSLGFLSLTVLGLIRMGIELWRDNRRLYRLERQRKKKILEMLVEQFHSASISERPYFLQLRELVTRKKWWNFSPFPKVFAIISVITIIIPIIVELFSK